MTDPAKAIAAALDAAAPESDDSTDDFAPAREKLSDCDGDALALCALERQNDFGNGQRLLRHFGRDLVAVREVGWHAWVDTHFEPEGGAEKALRLAHRTAERIHLEADLLAATPAELRAIAAGAAADEGEAGDEARKLAKAARGALEARGRKRRGFAVSSGNAPKLAAMIGQALPYAARAPGEMDRDLMRLNLLNGTLAFSRAADPDCPDPDIVRLKGRVELLRHDREDLMTRVAPAQYDPAAAAPKWTAFLARFQPNERVRRFLQIYHGYGLLGLTGEQVLVFNYGTGSNGKSTFMETIASVMGPYAQTLNAESVTGEGQRRGDQATPEFARLPGARLVRVSELPRGSPLKEALIKALTGGEPMLVRHLNHRFFEFRPTFKAAMSGNDLPQIGGGDFGIWRRMRLVNWEVMIAETERRPMEAVLAEFELERAGILNWLVEGALAYLTEGLLVPPEVRAATDHYQEEMDPLGNFISACVERVEDSDAFPARERAQVVFEAFVSWCMANSVKPWTMNAFGRAFPQKGFRRINGRIREYCGLRLNNVPERPRAPDEGFPDMR